MNKVFQIRIPFLFILFLTSFGITTAFCQSGFSKILSIDKSLSLNIDDIYYYENELIVKGNSYDSTAGIWGAFAAGLDTNGVLLWHTTVFDSTRMSHISTNTPSRVFVNSDKEIMMPNNYFNYNKIGLIVLDSLGNELYQRIYSTPDLILMPFDIAQWGNDFYLFGIVQRPSYRLDVFVMKLDDLGNSKWIKYYYNEFPGKYNEIFGGLVDNKNGTFSVCAGIFPEEYYTIDEITGWTKPWIFTIDTAGIITHQWIGEENDSRTNGRGPFYRAINGDYIITSFDIKEVPNPDNPIVRTSPTITRLDSNFNLVWKTNLTDYTGWFDKIEDIEYDSARDQFIVAGNLLLFYPNGDRAVDAWFVKLDSNGDVIWNETDSALFVSAGAQEHFTAGLTISPSGSIYVGGWVYTNRGYGFIIKVTPDGCSDTICTSTSIHEQIERKKHPISLYPNPVSESCHLFISEDNGNYNLEIYDSKGYLVMRKIVHSGENEILTDFPSGLYFYVVKKKDSWIGSGKFLKVD